MFALAIRWEMREDNPAKGVDRNHEEKRNRYLSGDELRRLTVALAAHPNQNAANAIRLLLLTGARKGEVLRATWGQFNLDTGIWTKPSSHTKQKREHRVPLSAPARALLALMKAEAEQRASEKGCEPSPYVFPSGHRDGPLVELNSWPALCRAADLRDVRMHDLRHTYASVLVSAGVGWPMIGALLGHSSTGTTMRYSHLVDDPLRLAAERAAAIITGNGDERGEVIPLGRRGGR
jgi:integrase